MWCFAAVVLLSLCSEHAAAFAAEPSFDAMATALANAEWRVRDVGENAGLLKGEQAAASLQLTLEQTREERASCASFTCAVQDLRQVDRAVTLAFCIPLDAFGWTWWDDPETVRTIGSSGVFSNIIEEYFGYAYRSSQYPLAVISNGRHGLCIGVPLDPPRAVRFLYDAAAREFRAEFDLGLSPIPEHFPSRAGASALAYAVPSRWAFREALQRYYAWRPDAFARRAKHGGTFLTKSPLERIDRPEDFGFAWHDFPSTHLPMAESDKALGIGSFIYREPQTHWRELRGDAERSYEGFVAQLKEDAAKGDRRAQGTLVSAVERADGRMDLYLDPVAWTKSAPFGVNADPEVRIENQGDWPNTGQYELEDLGRALGWDGTPAKADGVFYDSMEGWTNLLNYRRDHWKTARYPLTFDRKNGNRVCLSNLWGNYAMAKELAARLRSHGQLLMGNGAFHFLWMFAPFVDIPGREYSWYQDGKWTPVPDERFLFLRSMTCRRPCWLLMNDPFEDASHMEEYFQRCLFYAVFPSMFHAHTGTSAAYFWDPKYPNRDRPLFMKYVPLVRMLDEAGWEPVPYAVAEPEGTRIERYGTMARGDLAFTIHNRAPKEGVIALRLSRKDLQLPSGITAIERIAEKGVTVEMTSEDAILRLSMIAGGYAVVTVNEAAPSGR